MHNPEKVFIPPLARAGSNREPFALTEQTLRQLAEGQRRRAAEARNPRPTESTPIKSPLGRDRFSGRPLS
jgi:hypothetical protein